MTLIHSAFSGSIPGSPDHPSLVEFSHIYPRCHQGEVLSLLLTFQPLVSLSPSRMYGKYPGNNMTKKFTFSVSKQNPKEKNAQSLMEFKDQSYSGQKLK